MFTKTVYVIILSLSVQCWSHSVGTTECPDGSDKTPTSCANITEESGCILPSFPENGIYTVNNKSNFKPGDTVSGIVILDFTCKKGYQLDGIADIACNVNNKWNRIFPTCLRTCSPRISPLTLDIKCTRNGLPVDCTKPVLDGTRADVSCKQEYHFPPGQTLPAPYNQLVCEDGSWDYNLVECIPVCGKKNVGPIAIGGSKHLEYPWHVGIYMKINVGNTTKYSYICSGTIIHASAIITAAHCLENLDPTHYRVGAGKYYKSWNDQRDTNAQLRNAQRIHISDLYQGAEHNYANDIAILIVDKPFEFNSVVRPVCLDWTGSVEKIFLRNGSIGLVSGWAREADEVGDAIELRNTLLPYIPYPECYNDSPEDFRPFVGLADKICVGRTGQMCGIRSGSGLTFQEDDRFYLMGILSIGPPFDFELNCTSYRFVTSTKFSVHEQWVKNIIRKLTT